MALGKRSKSKPKGTPSKSTRSKKREFKAEGKSSSKSKSATPKKQEPVPEDNGKYFFESLSPSEKQFLPNCVEQIVSQTISTNSGKHIEQIIVDSHYDKPREHINMVISELGKHASKLNSD